MAMKILIAGADDELIEKLTAAADEYGATIYSEPCAVCTYPLPEDGVTPCLNCNPEHTTTEQILDMVEKLDTPPDDPLANVKHMLATDERYSVLKGEENESDLIQIELAHTVCVIHPLALEQILKPPPVLQVELSPRGQLDAYRSGSYNMLPIIDEPLLRHIDSGPPSHKNRGHVAHQRNPKRPRK